MHEQLRGGAVGPGAGMIQPQLVIRTHLEHHRHHSPTLPDDPDDRAPSSRIVNALELGARPVHEQLRGGAVGGGIILMPFVKLLL